MNETKKTEERRTIDDAQVRAQAHQVEVDLDAISYYAGDLNAKLEILDKELRFADPVKDHAFEKFMYKLQRLVLELQSLKELKKLTKTMEEFGLPSAAEVAAIIRDQRVGTALAHSRIHMPNVQKHLIEEAVHA